MSSQREKKMEPCTRWSIKTGTQRKLLQKNSKTSISLLLQGTRIHDFGGGWREVCAIVFGLGADKCMIPQLTVASMLPGNSMLSGFPILNKENFQFVQTYSNH